MSNINHEYKSCYVHVPKTAGTSMEGFHFVGGNGHETIEELDPPDDYFRWGFVRNPFDRIYSAYCGIKATERHEAPYIKSMDFKEWVKWVYDGALECDDRRQLHEQTKPMTQFLTYNTYIAVDFIGRFENIQEDWKRIQGALGVQPTALPHHNKIDHKPYKMAYDKETEVYIRSLYVMDFLYFGYGDKLCTEK